MKEMIKLASLFVVAIVMTGCSCWNNDCCDPCQPKCCPAPRIWDNNCCDQGPSSGFQGY